MSQRRESHAVLHTARRRAIVISRRSRRFASSTTMVPGDNIAAELEMSKTLVKQYFEIIEEDRKSKTGGKDDRPAS